MSFVVRDGPAWKPPAMWRCSREAHQEREAAQAVAHNTASFTHIQRRNGLRHVVRRCAHF